jgi:hypothetical protein
VQSIGDFERNRQAVVRLRRRRVYARTHHHLAVLRAPRHRGARFSTRRNLTLARTLSTTPTTVPIMIPATMKAIVPVSIVITSPIPTVLIVVWPVIRRRIRERFDDCDTWKANSDTDVRMSLGGDTLSHTCDPESGS